MPLQAANAAPLLRTCKRQYMAHRVEHAHGCMGHTLCITIRTQVHGQHSHSLHHGTHKCMGTALTWVHQRYAHKCMVQHSHYLHGDNTQMGSSELSCNTHKHNTVLPNLFIKITTYPTNQASWCARSAASSKISRHQLGRTVMPAPCDH